MKDNFWDAVADAPEKESSAPALVPGEPTEVFAPSQPAFDGGRSSLEVVESGRIYTAQLSDFDVSAWDSENDAQDIIDWFNREYAKQGGSKKSLKFFKEATDIANFNSKADAKTFLALALGILNGKIDIDKNGELEGWISGDHPQWMKQYEAAATKWANIAAASAFTILMIVVLVSGSILTVSVLGQLEGQDWPTGEAEVIEFEEWVETSCDEDGCSDTQYAYATFMLHCFSFSGDQGVEWKCSGNETENTTAFEHTYESGYFEHAPVRYMIDELSGESTHTIAYNPLNPEEVDLRPGFQMNWEWILPVIIPCAILLVIARNPSVSVKGGYACIFSR